MIRILKWFLIAFIFPWYLCLGQDLTSIPELTGPVVDQVGLLGDNEKSQLEQKLKAFYQTSQVQSQILIISTLGQEPIENYSIRVVEKWKLGHKDSDLGLLLTIVKDDRKMRIEVGQGLEGEITDFTCSRIIRQILAPHFKNGSFYQGLLLYHQEIESLVKGNATSLSTAPVKKRSSHSTIILLIMGAIFLFSTIFSLLNLKKFKFIGAIFNGGLYCAILYFFLRTPFIGTGLLFYAIIFVVGFFTGLFGRNASHYSPGSSRHRWGGGFGGFGHGGGGGGWSGGGGGFSGGGSSGSW